MTCGPRASRSMSFTYATIAVARAVRLARRLLAERQDALRPAEVDDEVVALLEAPDDALDELALAVLELVEDEVALFVADALDEDLLGGLRGDAPERLCAFLTSRSSPNSLSCSAARLRRRRGRTPGSQLLADSASRPALAACDTVISRPSMASSSSTTLTMRNRSTEPVSRLNFASISRFMPNVRLAAVRIACSSALKRTVLSMFLSRPTCSRTMSSFASMAYGSFCRDFCLCLGDLS